MSVDVQTGVLLDTDKLRKLAETLADRQIPTGFDVETGYAGPDRPKGSLDHDWDQQFTCGFSLSIGTDRARYVPLRHDGGGNVDDPEKAWWAIKPLLTRGVVVAHNARYEMRSVHKAAGYALASDGGTLRDTMLDAYVLSKYRVPGQYRAVHGLKELVEIVLDHRMTHFDELFETAPTNRYKTAMRFNVLDATDPKVIRYACEDAAWCLALENVLGPLADRDRPAMRRIEHQISVIMADVERHGVAVDWEAIGRASAEYDQFVPLMEIGVKAGLSALVGGRDLTDLNLGSATQLKQLLYRDAGLRTTRLTKGAESKVDAEEWEKMSTDAIAMEGLSRKHPPIRQLLEIRETKNLGSRLGKWLKEYRFAADGRVHASYSQTTVGSGRFAAGDPAIQQLPKQWRWAADPEIDPWAKPGTPEGDAWEALLADPDKANGGSYWAGSFRDFLVAGQSQIDRARWAGHDVGDLQRAEVTETGSYLLTFDYCVAPETRVLTSDMRWVRADEIQTGDELVGFDEHGHRSAKLRRSTVEGTRRVVRDCYRVTFDDGSTVTASGDHLWVSTGTSQGPRTGHPEYAPASLRKWVKTRDLVEGRSHIAKWLEPWDELTGQDALDAAWLGGVLDGEGWVMGNCVGFGQLPGLVLDKFKRVCKDLGYELGADYANKGGVVRTYFRGNVNSLRAVAQSGSVRLGGDRMAGMWEGRQTYTSHGAAGGTSKAVVRVEFLGDQETVAIQTSTRTFIAEGLLSHNSQIELRVLAGESQEPALLEAFQNGVDVHTATAAMMLGIPVDKVDDVDRSRGKTLNFALLYGMGIKSLAERLALSVEEAKQLNEQYFARLSRVASWTEKARNRGLAKGYCETRFGRKYTVWELQSDAPGVRAKGERVLINAPIQGGAADYMKMAMIRAHRLLTAKGWWMNGCTIVMNQHDSLTFEVSDALDPNEVRALLQRAVVFDVPANPTTGQGAFPPIVADWELGQRWGSSAKWKEGYVAVRGAEHWELRAPDAPEPVPAAAEEEVQANAKPSLELELTVAPAPLATVHALPARTLSQEPPTPALLIRSDHAPTADQFDRLLRVLDRHPGGRPTALLVPAGRVPLGDTGLTAEHAAEVSAVLGGATVEDEVRLADVRHMGDDIAL